MMFIRVFAMERFKNDISRRHRRSTPMILLHWMSSRQSNQAFIKAFCELSVVLCQPLVATALHPSQVEPKTKTPWSCSLSQRCVWNLTCCWWNEIFSHQAPVLTYCLFTTLRCTPRYSTTHYGTTFYAITPLLHSIYQMMHVTTTSCDTSKNSILSQLRHLALASPTARKAASCEQGR